MARILIVDDDADVHEGLGPVLRDEGFEVASAYNADEGIEAINAEKPDLLILDVLMPTEYEGFEMAREVRGALKLRDLPIIILSAVHQVKEVPYRFAPDETYLPVDVFMDKPVDPRQLCDKVRELLGEPRAEADAEVPL
jgi:two-component system alkaline phosphatase synthesis response regulator PhoP